MIGALVNTLAVCIGSLIGLLLKKGIQERFVSIMHQALGLSTICIAILGMIKGENELIIILSVVIGALIGEAVRMEDRLNGLADRLGRLLVRGDAEQGSLVLGFTTGTIFFCIGSMAIVGSLQSGLQGDHNMIYAKSLLDFITSIIFASTMGIGVMLSAVSILVFQGSIVLSAQFLAPFLSDSIINNMVAAGSVLVFAIGLNLALKQKIKVSNLLPAVFLPLVFGLVAGLFG